jgi:hypothetical protein
MVKVAVEDPAGTVTDAGTLATVVVLLVSVTTTASVATPDNVTVPVLFVPPLTLVGFKVSVETTRTGFTVMDAALATPLRVPVIVKEDATVTVRVVTVKVAVVDPAATVTLAGTVPIVVDEDVSVTTAPPVGAALVNVTVPVTVLPPVTAETLVVRVAKTAAGGVTVTIAVPVDPLVDAVRVAFVLATTVPAVTVNVAVRAPAATVTETGTLATAALLDERLTTLPPTGALVESVTVPVVVPRLATDAAAKVTLDTLGPRILRVDLSFAPYTVAEMTALVSLLTTFVVTVKVVVIAPAGIVTLDPTKALKLEDARATVVPPVGAGPEMLRVPTVDVPPLTGFTDQITDDGIGARTLINAL